MRLDKVKRPGGLWWFDLRVVADDADGTWLIGDPGARWGAPHDTGEVPFPFVVLVAPDRPWATWWVAEPGDPRVEIDVCLPPERTERGWTYVDLELDPVLHVDEGRVEIEDWDEYDDAIRDGHMSVDDAELARATAEDLAGILRAGDAPWLARGWDLLGGP